VHRIKHLLSRGTELVVTNSPQLEMVDSGDEMLASSTASPQVTLVKELLAGTAGGTAQVCFRASHLK